MIGSYYAWSSLVHFVAAAAAAKPLQSCPTLCDPTDDSPPGSPVPGILQARTLEWAAISFSNAWKWKVNWSCSVVSNPQQPRGLQPSRLLRPWDFPGKSTGVGCHCLLCYSGSNHQLSYICKVSFDSYSLLTHIHAHNWDRKISFYHYHFTSVKQIPRILEDTYPFKFPHK